MDTSGPSPGTRQIQWRFAVYWVLEYARSGSLSNGDDAGDTLPIPSIEIGTVSRDGGVPYFFEARMAATLAPMAGSRSRSSATRYARKTSTTP